MTTQRINLEKPLLPDPRKIAWFEANGIAPISVPAAQEVLVEDGHLTFIQFVFDEEGRKFLSRDGDGHEKTIRTIPLISAPEAHGL